MRSDMDAVERNTGETKGLGEESVTDWGKDSWSAAPIYRVTEGWSWENQECPLEGEIHFSFGVDL